MIYKEKTLTNKQISKKVKKFGIHICLQEIHHNDIKDVFLKIAWRRARDDLDKINYILEEENASTRKV